MFLSKLVLNVRDRQARSDLARPYEMHRTLWRAFPEGDPGRILFRVDADRDCAPPIVLVQSDLRPDWERLAEKRADALLALPDMKEYQPSFFLNQRLRFRLRANPTKKVGAPSKSERLAGAKGNGRRLALLGEEEQVAWLLDKGELGGFRISGRWFDGPDGKRASDFRVDVIPEGWVRCGKEGCADGRFYAVRFEGVLEVVDPVLFVKTVGDGLGSAKGFGFGLLSVAPWRD